MALTPRDKLTDEISLQDLFLGVKTGKWKDEVLKARKLYGTARYDSYRKKFIPGVWLHQLPLMVFDWEEEDVGIPAKNILTKFRSVGGKGWAVIVPLPPDLDPEQWREARKAIQTKWGIVSNDRQIANDRVRFVSYDPEIKVNWSAVPMEVPDKVQHEEFKQGHGEGGQLYADASSGKQPLDNDTALSVFSYLRASAYSLEETVNLMEALPFKSKTLATRTQRDKYYDKWERQYGESYPVAKVVIKGKATEVKQITKIQAEPTFINTEEVKEDITVSDAEQVDLTIAATIAPFLPLDIDYFGDLKSVAHATLFVGSPSSGKGYINKVVTALDDITEKIDERILDWRIDYHSGIVKVNGKTIEPTEDLDEKKIKRSLPNLFLHWGFQGSEASLLGAVSEVGTVLMHSSEFSASVAALGQEHNKGLMSTILMLTESETIQKILKRNDAFGKTAFKLKGYRAGLVLGGTPGTVRNFFGNAAALDNGIVSRILFVALADSKQDKKALMVKPDIGKHLNEEQIYKTVTGTADRFAVHFDTKWIQSLKIELKTEYEGTPMEHCVFRGVRDAIKRAAVFAWMAGERKKFTLTRKDIEVQLEYFYKSQKFIEAFQDTETDKWGMSLISQKIQTGKEIVNGKAVQIHNGIKVSEKDAKAIADIYSKTGNNISQTAILLKTSRMTIVRILKRMGVK